MQGRMTSRTRMRSPSLGQEIVVTMRICQIHASVLWKTVAGFGRWVVRFVEPAYCFTARETAFDSGNYPAVHHS